MKIGIITYAMNAGGVSTFILSLARFFISKGHSVEIITTEAKGKWFDEPKKLGIQSYYIKGSFWSWIPFGKLIYSRKVGSIIKKHSFDIVLINNSIHAQIGAYQYKQSKIISVIHNHNQGVYKTSTTNLCGIDNVVCVSKATFEGAKEFVREKEKLYCIPNGIILPKVAPHFPKIINKEEGLKIIFVGRLVHEQKGILLLPDILKECRKILNIKFHLTIIGEGKDKEKLIEKLKETRTNDLVTFTGNIPNNTVYDLYLSHHIFLMPSFYEGLPLTLLEGMACGCIPVVSYLKDITDVCITNKKEGYLVNIDNIEGFTTAIKEISIDENSYKMGQESHKKITEYFTVERMGNDYIQLFSNKSFSKKKPYPISWKDIIPEKFFLLKKLFQ